MIKCKVCDDNGVMRMQTTEYEDWFCLEHFTQAMECVTKTNELNFWYGENK